MGFSFISNINLDQQKTFFRLNFQNLLGFFKSNVSGDQLTDRKTLESPCIQQLRSGPCGSQFSEALLCFLKSSKEEKGSDCVKSFVGLKKCILSNPNAFKNQLERQLVEENKPTQEYIFHPRYMVREKKAKSKARLSTATSRNRKRNHDLTE